MHTHTLTHTPGCFASSSPPTQTDESTLGFCRCSAVEKYFIADGILYSILLFLNDVYAKKMHSKIRILVYFFVNFM